MKKILIIALFASGLLLAGCGGEADSEKNETTGEAAGKQGSEVGLKSRAFGPTLKASNEEEFYESLFGITDWFEEEVSGEASEKFFVIAEYVYLEEPGGPGKLDGVRASRVLEMAPEAWEQHMEAKRKAREDHQEAIREYNELSDRHEEQRQEMLEEMNGESAP